MYAYINQQQTFYTTLGYGRPFLLMHDGPGLDHTHLRPWLDGLGRSAQLIYYDQLYQEQPEGDQLAQADNLRAYLGHEQMVLFGFAAGGLLAQAYALRYPHRLAGLILCCPLFGSDLERLTAVTTPTLVLAGRHDPICPPEQTAECCHAALPNSQLIIFDQSGHFPFRDEPERLTAVVATWLAALA